MTPQTIRVTSDLTVHLYDAEADLQAAYMYQGGEADKIRKVKGFYSDRDNAIHCLKWDFHACGHELYHALQYKGSQPLTAEEGFEHFREGNYASE